MFNQYNILIIAKNIYKYTILIYLELKLKKFKKSSFITKLL